jgi:hypothetical protein
LNVIRGTRGAVEAVVVEAVELAVVVPEDVLATSLAELLVVLD